LGLISAGETSIPRPATFTFYGKPVIPAAVKLKRVSDIIPQEFIRAADDMSAKFYVSSSGTSSSSAAGYHSNRKKKYRGKAGIDYGIYFMVMLDQNPQMLSGEPIVINKARQMAKEHSLFAHPAITVDKIFEWGDKLGYLLLSKDDVVLTAEGQQYYQLRNQPKASSPGMPVFRSKIHYPVWVNSNNGKTSIGKRPEGKNWMAYTNLIQITHPRLGKGYASVSNDKTKAPKMRFQPVQVPQGVTIIKIDGYRCP